MNLVQKGDANIKFYSTSSSMETRYDQIMEVSGYLHIYFTLNLNLVVYQSNQNIQKKI